MVVSRDSSPPSDPLERLLGRIESARRYGVLRLAGTDDDLPASRTDGDPLEALESHLERATVRRVLAEQRAGEMEDVPEPLRSLYLEIRRGRSTDPIELPEAYRREEETDPLRHLASMIEREIDDVGGRPTVERAERGGFEVDTGAARGESESLDAVVGRRLLEVLEDEPLPGPDRAEAVRRLALQLDSPDTAELRRILRLLLG